MSTLYKRATPAQARILRAVEGAVKNAADAHPEMKFDRRFARSIAKRAAGTLTAQWPDVLAAKKPSDRAEGATPTARSRRLASNLVGSDRRGAPRANHGRSPLELLWKQIAIKMRAVKRFGPPDEEAAYIDVLRMIAALKARAADNGSGNG